MAKTFTAAFAQTPRTAQALVTASSASINTTTPTNVTLLATAGADGSILTSLSAITGSTNAGSSVLLWISKDGGTTKYLADCAVLEAYSNSTTAVRVKVIFADITEANPMRLEAGDELYVGAELTGAYHFKAELTDY